MYFDAYIKDNLLHYLLQYCVKLIVQNIGDLYMKNSDGNILYFGSQVTRNNIEELEIMISAMKRRVKYLESL